MQQQLTTGFIAAVQEGHEKLPQFAFPHLQIVAIKKVTNNQNTDRYRIVISDGVGMMQAMLATQLNSLCVEARIVKNTIVKLDRFTLNVVQDKNVLIIFELSVITPFDNQVERIGNSNIDPDLMANNTSNSNNNSKPMNTMATPNRQNIDSHNSNKMNTPQNNMTRGDATSPPSSCFPINVLTPYTNKQVYNDKFNKRWTICARVINKSDIREWKNEKSQGKLFSVTFADESGEIKATVFNEAVSSFYDLIQEQQVYYVSNGQIKGAKRQYSTVNNDYEMTLDSRSNVLACGNAVAAPKLKYNPVKMANLISVEKDGTVDIIVVAKEVMECTEIITKASKKLSKRDLMVADDSGYQVRLTLWGKQAESFDYGDCPVLAIKGIKVGDYGGRSLSLMGSASLQVNPDIPEAHFLKGWFTSNSHMNFQMYSSTDSGAGTKRDPFKTIAQIKEENLGQGEKPDYFTIRGTIVHIKQDNLMYPACPTEGCNKKVSEENGGWRCEKCNQTYPSPNYRYIIAMSVSDYSGQLWPQAFNEIGELLFNLSGNEMNNLKEFNRPEYDELFQKVLFSEGTFKLRAKQENYQDESKIRFSIVSYTPIDYVQACTELIESNKMLLGH